MPDAPLAVIDIDDVLADTTPLMLDHLNRKLGTAYTMDDMHVFGMSQALSIPREEVVLLINSNEFQMEIAPMPGAAAGLARLREQGCEVWLVTGRPEIVRPSTEAWLARGGFAYDHLVMGLAGSEKVEALPRAPLLACDDRADAVTAYAAVAQVAYLYARPWNRDGAGPENMRRVEGWGEIIVPGR